MGVVSCILYITLIYLNALLIAIYFNVAITRTTAMIHSLCTDIFGFNSKIDSVRPADFSVVVVVDRRVVELVIVIFDVEMFVSFNCSAVGDLEVGPTAVYAGAGPVDGQGECLVVVGPVPGRGSIVPVELLHDVCYPGGVMLGGGSCHYWAGYRQWYLPGQPST